MAEATQEMASMTSEDRKRLSEIGYQVIDAKNEHVENGWIVRVPNDDKRVLIAASEGDAWDAARDYHASMTSEVTQAALEPCPNPWCNSRKTVDCEIRAAEAPILMPSRSSAEWAVACPVCPLQTPYFDTEVEAIAAWNTRPTAQSGEQQSCEPIATVEMIETVTGDFYTDPGEPIWRVMVGEYCADFDSEQAARNFASAINLAAQSGEGRSGAGEDALREAVRRFLPTNINLDAVHLPDEATIPLDVTMGELRELRAALNARQSGEGEREALPRDVRRLVIAARLALESQDDEALGELDRASEAFASLVPWNDEPEDVTYNRNANGEI